MHSAERTLSEQKVRKPCRVSQECTALVARIIGIGTRSGRRSIREAQEYAAMHRVYDVNALGPLRVLEAFLPLCDRGTIKRLCFVSSEAGSIARSKRTTGYGYCMSKAALNAAGKSLAHDLAPRGVSVAILHPGYVRTDMTGGNGLMDVEEAAEGLLARLDELTPENSGTFWNSNGDILPW